MPSSTAKRLCLALFWIAVFSIAVVVSVVPLWTKLPAKCTILSWENEQVQNPQSRLVLAFFARQTDKDCRAELKMNVAPENGDDPFEASTEQMDFNCEDQRYQLNRTGRCWYRPWDKGSVEYATESNQSVLDADYKRYNTLRIISAVMAAFLGLCMLISIVYMFREELLRWCPRFLLTLCMNLQSFFSRTTTTPPSQPSQPEQTFPHQITPPRTAVSRRRISTLVENTKLSHDQVRALHAQGWTCCVCLEEYSEAEAERPISRLPCGHATHSECLQSWLEKGRGVCCLCNADVFANEQKENHNLSPRTSLSGMDGGPPGSLEVERTEGAPSSLATSLFIELAQSHTRTTVDAPADENDCPADTQT